MSAWTGHMFGLAVDSAVPLAGCQASAVPDGLARTELQTASRADVHGLMPAAAEPIGSRTEPDGRRVPDVLAHPQAGYRLPAPGYGTFHISPAGERIAAAPNAIPAWRWQRYLIGRVLPFAALLAGLEPLHASAVATSQGAVVIAGEPGAGKSTLAAALVLAGLSFMADDVVALHTSGETVLAHPGAPLLSLRPPTQAAVGGEALRRLGTRVGADRLGLRLSVARAPTALPVRAVYFLGAGVSPATHAARLLGHTFNAVIRDPARGERQLDVCATLARSARLVDLPALRSGDARALVPRILEDLAAR